MGNVIKLPEAPESPHVQCVCGNVWFETKVCLDKSNGKITAHTPLACIECGAVNLEMLFGGEG